MYELKGHSETTLVHESTDPSELWHRRLAHINYKALPHVNKVVTGLPDMKIKHEAICKGCAKGNNIKNPFPKSETKTKGVGLRADLGSYAFILAPTNRPRVLALSATTCEQVAISPETTMGCHRISFL